MLGDLWIRFRALFRRNAVERELDRELRFHFERQVEKYVQAGLPPEEARRRARLEFGGLEQVKEECREARGVHFVETLWQDIHYGLRMLGKNPGFTAVAVLTLALGIGGNTAIFSFVDAVLLRPLPVNHPQQLVVFSWTARHRPKFDGHSDYGDCRDGVDCSLSVPFFQTVRARTGAVFSGVAAFAGPLDIDLSGNGPAGMARGTWVSGDFFSTLGVGAVLGRPLGRSDDLPSAPPAIVLSYAYWQRAFAGQRSAVGRMVRLNTVPATIVGIADPRFTNLTPGKTQDFFMPLSLAGQVKSEWWGNDNRTLDPASWWAVIIGRLKPGVSIGRAQAAATTLFRNELVHGAKPMSAEADAPAIELLPAREGLSGESSQMAPLFYLLTATVGFVLLIACANVAGLLLARSAARQKEMAVRRALGAGRGRLARQLLTESVLLSAMGGALGLLGAAWSVELITRMISGSFGEPFWFSITLDWRVLAFTLALTLAAGILFGVAPALRGARLDLTPSLKEGGSAVPGAALRGRPGPRLGDALVVAQVSLSIVVLIGAGLLVRTLRNLQTLNPGFDTRNVLLFAINPTIAGYNDRQTAQLYGDLQRRFAALPGVLSASYSEDALLSDSWSAGYVHLDGAPPESNANTAILAVGPNFFSTMRIPVLAGRSFAPADFASAAAVEAAQKAARDAAQKAAGSSPATPSAPAPSGSASAPSATSAPPVPVMINEVFARKFFPGQNPFGRHMGDAQQRNKPPIGPQPGYRIVGIVANAKYNNLRRHILPTMYVPLVSNSAHFELRTAGDPAALVKSVRDLVSRADANLPLFDVRSQTQQVERTLFRERLMARLSSLFGLLALLLACIGLYGLLAYEVARRNREIGIRMALGARQRDVLRLVVRQGVHLALTGATIGIAAAEGLTRFMSGMLYGVRGSDPATTFGAAILLATVALVACYIPARRATQVDPMAALRHE